MIAHKVLSHYDSLFLVWSQILSGVRLIYGKSLMSPASG